VLNGRYLRPQGRLEALGGHWDGDRRAWWVGAAKASEAEALVARLAAVPWPAPGAPRPAEDPDSIRLTGKGRYKGRVYYAGAITRDGTRVRLLTLPDASGKYLDFWVPCSEVKRYQPREYRGRIEYTTLGSIARFLAREQRARPAGEPVCAECGKSGELVADLEDGQLEHRRCCDIEP
jgi:hypothetical protein